MVLSPEEFPENDKIAYWDDDFEGPFNDLRSNSSLAGSTVSSVGKYAGVGSASICAPESTGFSQSDSLWVFQQGNEQLENAIINLDGFE